MKRAHFLQKVSSVIGNRTLPDQDDTSTRQNALATADLQTLMNKFIEEANAVKAETHLASDDEVALETVMQLLNNQTNNKYMSWDDGCLPIKNLEQRLDSADYLRYQSTVPRDTAKRTRAHIKLAEVSVGITGCNAALADTGSIVLESKPGQGRLSSLLPAIHIALITTDQIYPTMESYIKSQP
ncbi:MAG TPA: LUD domain-containing protein, partial [Anaerolineales bacterium]|nr:LUD domain-containing protein [Anaerolineales bacterium]